ncbi:MAG: hypothetical protein WAL41_17905 [Mycobacterium sp.]
MIAYPTVGVSRGLAQLTARLSAERRVLRTRGNQTLTCDHGVWQATAQYLDEV